MPNLPIPSAEERALYGPGEPRKSIADELQERRRNVVAQAQAIAQKGVVHGRDLSKNEQAEFDALIAEADKLAERANAIAEGEARAVESEKNFRSVIGRGSFEDEGGHPDLRVSAQNLRAHWDAITQGGTYSARETRAMLTTGTNTGSPGGWGSSSPAGAITLRAFAGVPISPLVGVSAELSSLTLPAGAAGVAETANHGEFTGVAPQALSSARYGRWSNASAAVKAFTDLDSLNGAHAVGIARDLNLLDITAIQTAAGTATVFDAAKIDENVRAAILTVAEATLGEPENMVLFGTAASLAVVTGYAPANGSDRGSVSTRVHGARVYASAAATAGIVTAFNPQSFRAFMTQLSSATTMDPANGSTTFGSWLHSTAVGEAIVGGAKSVDVLGP